MAKRTSKRRKLGKPQSRPAVRIGGVLTDVIDELASLVEFLRSASAASRNEPDEIAAWAGVLNVRLDDARRARSERDPDDPMDASEAIARHPRGGWAAYIGCSRACKTASGACFLKRTARRAPRRRAENRKACDSGGKRLINAASVPSG